MSAPDDVDETPPTFCIETTSSCRCRQPRGHEPPHVCPCGGSWHIDADGRFHVIELPPLFTIRPDLAYDKEW